MERARHESEHLARLAESLLIGAEQEDSAQDEQQEDSAQDEQETVAQTPHGS